jgi:hypothetical protein
VGYPRITINSDGSITPPTAPINRTGNIYILTDDLLEQTVVIHRNDVVFEGAGHTIDVPRKSAGDLAIYVTVGISLMPDEHAEGVTYRNNVTIRNVTILGSIEIYCGNNCLIENVYASDVWVDGNSNTIKTSTCGVGLSPNTMNSLITENNINDLWIGPDCASNKFYLNNFNLASYPGVFSRVFWDNGTHGNFWSNYTTKYFNAKESGNSGIGDTPYTIEKEFFKGQLDREYGGLANTTFMSIGYTPLVDRFPLMYPWGAPQVTLLNFENFTSSEPFSLNFSINKPVVWMGYSLDGEESITITGNTTLRDLTTGSHNVTIYAKDKFGFVGASENVKFTVAPADALSLLNIASEEGFLGLDWLQVAVLAATAAAVGLAVGAVLLRRRAKPNTYGRQAV